MKNSLSALFESIIIVLIIALANPLYANKNDNLEPSKKEFKQMYNKAIRYVDRENICAAAPIFTNLFEQNQENANLAFLIGMGYLHTTTRNLSKAKYYLEIATLHISEDYYEYDFKETKAPVIVLYHLAYTYQELSEFNNAIQCYYAYIPYLSNSKQDKAFIAEIKEHILACKNKIPLRNSISRTNDSNKSSEHNIDINNVQNDSRYLIQVGAGEMNMQYFNKLNRIYIYKTSNGIKKYISGVYNSFEEAQKEKENMVQIGYTDTWIFKHKTKD